MFFKWIVQPCNLCFFNCYIFILIFELNWNLFSWFLLQLYFSSIVTFSSLFKRRLCFICLVLFKFLSWLNCYLAMSALRRSLLCWLCWTGPSAKAGTLWTCLRWNRRLSSRRKKKKKLFSYLTSIKLSPIVWIL